MLLISRVTLTNVELTIKEAPHYWRVYGSKPRKNFPNNPHLTISTNTITDRVPNFSPISFSKVETMSINCIQCGLRETASCEPDTPFACEKGSNHQEIPFSHQIDSESNQEDNYHTRQPIKSSRKIDKIKKNDPSIYQHVYQDILSRIETKIEHLSSTQIEATKTLVKEIRKMISVLTKPLNPVETPPYKDPELHSEKIVKHDNHHTIDNQHRRQLQRNHPTHFQSPSRSPKCFYCGIHGHQSRYCYFKRDYESEKPVPTRIIGRRRVD